MGTTSSRQPLQCAAAILFTYATTTATYSNIANYTANKYNYFYLLNGDKIKLGNVSASGHLLADIWSNVVSKCKYRLYVPNDSPIPHMDRQINMEFQHNLSNPPSDIVTLHPTNLNNLKYINTEITDTFPYNGRAIAHVIKVVEQFHDYEYIRPNYSTSHLYNIYFATNDNNEIVGLSNYSVETKNTFARNVINSYTPRHCKWAAATSVIIFIILRLI